MTLRIVVTGGRQITTPIKRSLFAKLEELHRGPRGPIVRLAHGGATGADTAAGGWAWRHGIHCEPYPVSKQEWSELGTSAGPRRNARMLAQERPDLVVAAPGGRGTASCVEIARGMHIEVEEVKP